MSVYQYIIIININYLYFVLIDTSIDDSIDSDRRVREIYEGTDLNERNSWAETIRRSFDPYGIRCGATLPRLIAAPR